MSDLTTPSEPAAVGETAARTVDETLAQELVERARTEGIELVGPGGLLTGLTKTVLETALEAELDEHLGYPKHAVSGRNDRPPVVGPAAMRVGLVAPRVALSG
jgi:hypothetical protein